MHVPYMQRCTTSLIMRETQIKTQIKTRPHHTAVSKAKLNNTRSNRGWRGCGERRTSCTAGGNASRCSPSGKQYGSSPESWKYKYPTIQQWHSRLGIYPKDTKIQTRRRTFDVYGTPMFKAAWSTRAKLQREPKCPQTEEWRRCGVYIQWIITQPSKRMISYHLQWPR